MTTIDRSLSPRQLAHYLGVGPSKVLQWIRSGRIRAVNLASDPAGRPRWHVTPEALQEFLAARAATPAAPRPRRQRRSVGIDYYPDGE